MLFVIYDPFSDAFCVQRQSRLPRSTLERALDRHRISAKPTDMTTTPIESARSRHIDCRRQLRHVGSVSFVAVLVLLGSGSIGCDAFGKPPAPPGRVESEPISAELELDEADNLVVVETSTRTIRVPVTGDLLPIRRAEIAPAEPGYVMGLGPRERRQNGPGELPVGLFLNAGDTIVELENEVLLAELLRVTSQIEELTISLQGTEKDVPSELEAVRQTAATNLARLENLAQQRAIPQAQIDEANAAHARAVAAIETAKSRLAGYVQQRDLLARRVQSLTLRTPFSGRVSRSMVNVGMQARSDPLIELIDDSTLEFRFTVPDAFAPHVRVGTTRIAMRGLDLAPLTVTHIAPEIAPATRTLTAYARFANPARDGGNDLSAPRQFRAGAFVQADALLTVTGVFVPAESVRQIESVSVVFIVTPDNRVEARQVVRGISGDGRVQILSQLEPGEEIVTGYVPGIADGMPVRIFTKQPSPPPSQPVSGGR